MQLACLQRRCYWLLESEDDIVLVHYLNIAQRQHTSRISTRLHPDNMIKRDSSGPEASLDSDSDQSDDRSHTSDVEATCPAMTADITAELPAAAFPEVPLKSAEMYGPNLSSMSFDAFLAAMDSKEQHGMVPRQSGNFAAQEMLHRWNEELHLAESAAQLHEAPSWKVSSCW